MPGPVFLSHAWADRTDKRSATNPRRGLVAPLVDRLAAAGLRVFIDEAGIRPFDAIEERLRQELARASVFLAWYSDVYPTRRACHWELTAAFTTDPSRVCVLNPEANFDHILPASLRSRRFAAVPFAHDDPGWTALVASIVEFANECEGTFGDVARAADVRWFGRPATRFSRFVGRDKMLWTLDGLLRPEAAAAGGHGAPDAVALFGIGGVGKSALALEYATRFAAAYQGGIYWLRLAGPGIDAQTDVPVDNRIAEAHLTIVEQLPGTHSIDGETNVRLSPAQLRTEVRRHLDSLAQPFLWILDDFPPGRSAEEWDRCLPPGGRGTVLVTTQGTHYRHVPNLEVPVLGEGEALDLLLAEVGDAPQAEREAARVLAARLGYLPLALEVVACLAALPGASPRSLLAELEVGAQSPLALTEEAAANASTAPSRTGHSPSVLATFALSIARLDPPGFWLLAVCGTVNVAPLPVALLWSVAVALEPSLGRSSRQATGTLLSLSLARAIDDRTIEVHQLIGEAVGYFLADRPDLVAAAVALAQSRAREGLGDVEDIATHRLVRPVATFGQALATDLIATGREPVDSALLHRLGRFLNVEHRFEEAVSLESVAAGLARAGTGAESRESLVTRSNLALSLNRAGSSREAVQMLREAHRDALVLLGRDDADTLSIQHNLANALASAAPAESRALGQDAYERRRRLFGPDHPHTLFSLHSLLAQFVTPPPFHDAIDAYRDLIERRTRTLGADHTTTLTSRVNYAARLVADGCGPEAVLVARDVLEAHAALYGPTHATTDMARSRLLEALCATGQVDTLEFTAAVAEFEQRVDAGPALSALKSLSNTGEAMRQHGYAARAVALLASTLRIAATRLPDDDELVLLIAHNHAAATATAGDVAAASGLYDALLPRMRNALGAEHRLTLRARRQEALLALAANEFDRGHALQRELVDVAARVLGETSAAYAEALDDLATTTERRGDAAEARRLRARRPAAGARRSSAPAIVV